MSSQKSPSDLDEILQEPNLEERLELLKGLRNEFRRTICDLSRYPDPEAKIAAHARWLAIVDKHVRELETQLSS